MTLTLGVNKALVRYLVEIYNGMLTYQVGVRLPLADLKGAWPAHAPTAPNSFIFAYIHFWQKAPMLEVRTSLWEILDPPLVAAPHFDHLSK